MTEADELKRQVAEHSKLRSEADERIRKAIAESKTDRQAPTVESTHH